MDYRFYSTKDFVKDVYFQQWVLEPNADADVFWSDFLQNNPFKKAEVEEARQIITDLQFGRDYEANRAFIEVWEQINPNQEGVSIQEDSDVVSERSYSAKKWLRVAAVFIGLLATSIVFFRLTRQPESVQYATTFGEVKKITLPDSSEVLLNANSTLSYVPNWDTEKPREVQLQGEAFFSVRKKKTQGNAKFRVFTQELQVEVLGTEFNVANRRQQTQVVLNSGKVRINIAEKGQEQEILMKPNDLVSFSAASKQVVKKVVDPELYTSWRNNKLIFNKTPLSEIVRTLEDTYGYQVSVTDSSVLKHNFTGETPTDNISILLSSISRLYDLQITQQNNRLILKSR